MFIRKTYTSPNIQKKHTHQTSKIQIQTHKKPQSNQHRSKRTSHHKHQFAPSDSIVCLNTALARQGRSSAVQASPSHGPETHMQHAGV